MTILSRNSFHSVRVLLHYVLRERSAKKDRNTSKPKLVTVFRKLNVIIVLASSRSSDVNVKHTKLICSRTNIVVQVLNTSTKDFTKYENWSNLLNVKNLANLFENVNGLCGLHIKIALVDFVVLHSKTTSTQTLRRNNKVTRVNRLKPIWHNSETSKSSMKLLSKNNFGSNRKTIRLTLVVLNVVVDRNLRSSRENFSHQSSRNRRFILGNSKFLCHIIALIPVVTSRINQTLTQDSTKTNCLDTIVFWTSKLSIDSKFLLQPNRNFRSFWNIGNQVASLKSTSRHNGRIVSNLHKLKTISTRMLFDLNLFNSNLECTHFNLNSLPK